MQTIILIMTRQPVVQGLMKKLQETSDTHVLHEIDYSKARSMVLASNADFALIEVTETGLYDVNYCLTLCAELQGINCEKLLLCPEQDECCIAAVVNAKQKGLIRDFMFYDSSIDYLASKLLTR